MILKSTSFHNSLGSSPWWFKWIPKAKGFIHNINAYHSDGSSVIGIDIFGQPWIFLLLVFIRPWTLVWKTLFSELVEIVITQYPFTGFRKFNYHVVPINLMRLVYIYFSILSVMLPHELHFSIILHTFRNIKTPQIIHLIEELTGKSKIKSG